MRGFFGDLRVFAGHCESAENSQAWCNIIGDRYQQRSRAVARFHTPADIIRFRVREVTETGRIPIFFDHSPGGSPWLGQLAAF